VIRAHRTLFRDQERSIEERGRVERVVRAIPETDSLVAFRGVPGCRITGITFDANYAASRCVTFAVPDKAHRHHNGAEACAFVHAARELLHLGGELLRHRTAPGDFAERSDVLVPRYGDVGPAEVINEHFSGQHDLANPRFQRCLFDTGSADTLKASLEARGLSVHPAVGIVFMAQQTVVSEYHNCVFRGPAAPMIAQQSGRITLQGCSFHTRMFGLPWPRIERRLSPTNVEAPVVGVDPLHEGVDIALTRPPSQVRGRGTNESPEPLSSGTLMATNVVSRSRQFIRTFTDLFVAQDVAGCVVLMGVVHDPIYAPGEALRPAIIWGSVGWIGARLLLMGCTFRRPSHAGGGVLEPVEVRLSESHGTGDDALGALRGRFAGWESGLDPRGQVIDFGNRIVTETGDAAPLLSMRAMGAHARIIAGVGRLSMPDADALVSQAVSSQSVLRRFTVGSRD
jgi:hypothetical protein